MIPIKLYKGERIVAVVPELGKKMKPDIVWVYIDNPESGIRCRSITEEEMPSCMYIVHKAAAEMHKALVAMVKTEQAG